MTGSIQVPTPIVLGHEGSGTVVETGGDVTSVRPGQRVILSFVPSCGFCGMCRAGKSNLCQSHRKDPNRQYDGSFRLRNGIGEAIYQSNKLGLFAEEFICPEGSLFPIPDDVPSDVAALIGCCVTTGVGGVLHAPGIRPGVTVAVFGCGGVGLSAIQGARLLNASRIIAVDILDQKLQFSVQFGATDIVNADKEDPVEAIKGLTHGGVEYAFDTFGSVVTTTQAFQSLRPTGVGVVIGLAPVGDVVPVDLVDLVRNQKTITGSYYGATSPHESFRRLVTFYRQGRVDVEKLITRRYSLDDINDGFSAIEGGEDGRGVLIFDMETA